MRPEQRCAARLIKKLGLAPPIDVLALLQRFADVEFDSLPLSADAIFVRNPKGKTRPLVIVDNDKSDTRRRFTMAHELGHVRIPWHVGSLVCAPSAMLKVDEFIYSSMEAEANRFASELLMPQAWLAEEIARSGNIANLVRDVQNRGGVSLSAACLALKDALPPGYAFVLTRGSSTVELSGASIGTRVSTPQRGQEADTTALRSVASNVVTITQGAQQVTWFVLPNEAVLIESSDPRDSRQLLKDILAAVSSSAEERAKLSQQCNGVIGSANKRGMTAERRFALFKQRFADRPDLAQVSSHPEFELFLSKRAHELEEREQ